jgi:hypothetical protein
MEVRAPLKFWLHNSQIVNILILGKCENHEEILGEIIKESECEKCYTSTRQGLIEVFKTPHLRKALFIGIIALQVIHIQNYTQI